MKIQTAFRSYQGINPIQHLSYITLLGFWMLMPSPSFGQSTNIDSLKQLISTSVEDRQIGEAIVELLKIIAPRDPQYASFYLDSLEQLSSFGEHKNWQAWASNFHGDILLSDRKTDEGAVEIRKAISQFEALGDDEGLGTSWYNIGKKAWLTSDWVLALEAFSKSRQGYQKAGILTKEAAAVNGLGIAYYESRLTDKALDTYQEAYDLNETLGSWRGMANNLVNMGIVYNETHQYEKSADTYQRALEIAETLPQSDALVASIYNNLSVNYIELEEYNKAKKSAHESYKYHIQTNDKVYAAQALTNIANSNDKLGLKDLAANQYEEVFVLMEGQSDYNVLSDATLAAAHMHELSNNHKKANKYYRLHNLYKDSLLNATVASEVAALDAEYEAEKKEQEITLLNTKNELAETRLDATRKQNIGLGIGLGLLGLLLSFLLFAFRKIRKQNVIVKAALHDKEVLLKEIHHRVKNNLQVVSSLLSLQSNTLNDPNAKQALQEGRNRVKSMALIHRNLYQDKDLTKVGAKGYFKEMIENLFRSYNISPEKIKLEQDVDDISLDVDTLIPIGLIVNELISNALKYAFPDDRDGIVKISMREVDDKLHLQVRDNGVGINEDFDIDQTSSMGMNLINAFKNKLNADIDIHSENGCVIDLHIGEWKKVG